MQHNHEAVARNARILDCRCRLGQDKLIYDSHLARLSIKAGLCNTTTRLSLGMPEYWTVGVDLARISSFMIAIWPGSASKQGYATQPRGCRSECQNIGL